MLYQTLSARSARLLALRGYVPPITFTAGPRGAVSRCLLLWIRAPHASLIGNGHKTWKREYEPALSADPIRPLIESR